MSPRRPCLSRLLRAAAAAAAVLGGGAPALGAPGGRHGPPIPAGASSPGPGPGAPGIGAGARPAAHALPGRLGEPPAAGHPNHGRDPGDAGAAGLEPGRRHGADRGASADLRRGPGDDNGRRSAERPHEAQDGGAAALAQARQTAVRRLLRDHADLVEVDGAGNPVVRGEVLALSPSGAALARAQAAGYRVRTRDSLPALGVESVVLVAPQGTRAPQALRRLRALDPAGRYDLNHLYQESGGIAPRHGRGSLHAPLHAHAHARKTSARRGLKIGLVDGAVAANQPAFAGDRVIQKGFAPGAPRPTAHATAVASLLAGRRPPFRGAAPGATLYVADVYGATADGGSAEAIARALAWMARADVPVINISLVGPPNALLAAAVKALIERGQIVVAAVGNDGPASPPLYPASYPGVVAVTGVDQNRRVLPEASRSPQVAFAAPGSDMAAAGLDGGFVAVRGTSFAAPIAAGLLAQLAPDPSPQAAARAVAVLGRQALDLGRRGQDPVYGQGLVGDGLRVQPAEVHARAALRGP
jgi:hypothetical protein